MKYSSEGLFMVVYQVLLELLDLFLVAIAKVSFVMCSSYIRTYLLKCWKSSCQGYSCYFRNFFLRYKTESKDLRNISWAPQAYGGGIDAPTSVPLLYVCKLPCYFSSTGIIDGGRLASSSN